jgi:allantoin racemase
MVINPNVVLPMTKDIEDAAKTVAGPNTNVFAVSPVIGPTAIECHMEFIFAAAGVIDTIAKAEKTGEADAYIIACSCDPGLEAAREITYKPVVGIGEAAITFAKMLGSRFSIVTVLECTRKINEQRVRFFGVENICCSIRASHVGVLEFRDNPKHGIQALFDKSKLAVEQDGAECIVLGCAGFSSIAKEFSEKLGVPVLDGVTLAVKLAEDMIESGFKNGSKLSDAYLKTKTIKGFDFSF